MELNGYDLDKIVVETHLAVSELLAASTACSTVVNMYRRAQQPVPCELLAAWEHLEMTLSQAKDDLVFGTRAVVLHDSANRGQAPEFIPDRQ